MIQIEFAKLSGSGNDHICLDNRDGRFDGLLADPRRVGRFARALCARSVGIGGDGLIFAVEPEIEGVADIGARFFESDGSEAELCGNGTGCLVRWVVDSGIADDGEISILTPAGVVLGRQMDDSYVRVCIPLPEDTRPDLEVTTGDRTWRCDFVVTGVPHLITWVDDVEAVDVAHWGRALRRHEQFQPRGVNANFVQVLEPGRLAVRTFEFGVEGETLACGTGAAAAAILSATRFDWPGDYFNSETPVLVRTRSGRILRVYFNRREDGRIDDVCLETVVLNVCRGTVHPDLADRALDPTGSQAPAGTGS
jgi:diaminopimelate epimerase